MRIPIFQCRRSAPLGEGKGEKGRGVQGGSIEGIKEGGRQGRREGLEGAIAQGVRAIWSAVWGPGSQGSPWELLSQEHQEAEAARLAGNQAASQAGGRALSCQAWDRFPPTFSMSGAQGGPTQTGAETREDVLCVLQSISQPRVNMLCCRNGASYP